MKALSAAGIGYRRTADLAGVTTRTVWRILYEGGRPTAQTTERILAVSAEVGPAQRWEPALPSVRRLQALRSIGWSNLELSRRLGMSEVCVSQVAMERRSSVRPSTAANVRSMYAEMSETFPPMSATEGRNRTWALRRCWFPPIAWEEELVDDPAALPCLLPPVVPVDRDLELLVQHVVAGHPVDATADAQREVVRRMPDQRPRDVARLARCSPKYVSDVRARLEVAS